jgi:lysophospholipase L1-like esterase
MPKSRYMVFAQSLLIGLLLLAGCDAPLLSPLPADATVLAFGDSLTHGTGAGRAQAYPAVLARLTGLRVINAGVPGELSGEGLARLPDLLEAHQPDLLVLVHGGNDTLRNLSKSTTTTNLRGMIELSRERGSQVVMLGVPGRNLTLSVPGYYAEVADEMAVPIDTSVLPAIMRDRSLKSDAVHFNAAGYRRMAEAVRDLLREEGAIR